MQKNHAVRRKNIPLKLEKCVEDQGNPVPAGQDQNQGKYQQQVDQNLFARNFLSCRFKLYHIYSYSYRSESTGFASPDLNAW